MTFPLSTAHVDLKNEELKRRLMECVNEEKNSFLPLAEKFYQTRKRSDTDYHQLCTAIIAAVDHVLNAGEWDSSLFLRSTLKPLKEIREHALKLLENLSGAQTPAKYTSPTLSENFVKLYISLYQAAGHDLNLWAAQLASISSYTIGRPVYESEENVVQSIRRKLSQVSEAYIVVSVDKSKILGVDNFRPRKDRFGNTLVSLLPNAVCSEDILEFVHLEKRYYFSHGNLLPINNEVAA